MWVGEESGEEGGEGRVGKRARVEGDEGLEGFVDDASGEERRERGQESERVFVILFVGMGREPLKGSFRVQRASKSKKGR